MFARLIRLAVAPLPALLLAMMCSCATMGTLEAQARPAAQPVQAYIVVDFHSKKILSTQLKNLVASGKLVKVKASYKLGEALKKAPKKPKKAKKPKKKAPKKKKPKAKKAKVRARTNVLNF